MTGEADADHLSPEVAREAILDYLMHFTILPDTLPSFNNNTKKGRGTK